jgi:hypothetical protein
MKKGITFAFLLFLLTATHGEDPKLSAFIETMPNIVLGKIYFIGPSFFLMDVDWQLKGEIHTGVVEVPVLYHNDATRQLAQGDRVLVFIKRMATEPLKEVPLPDIQLSYFDMFNGQTAFLPIKKDEDYALISQVHEQMRRTRLAQVQ